jgi:TP901 family phage tail tape measure protein
VATEVAAAYVELGARIGKLEAGLASASAQVDAFGRKADARSAGASAAFSQMGRAAKIGTLAVAGGLALAVKSAATFDTQMSQVKAVTGATSKQMDALRQSAIRTSASTQGFGYTAKEVAQAQTELGKAGLSVAQIMGGGMAASLTLAKAGSLQLGDAASYTANAMAQFNLSGKQAGMVSDAMATAANVTTADVGDFGMALVQTGAAARSAGLSFNDTMTALTALAKSGVKGSDAGTSLKTSLIQLIKPTQKQAEAAKAAGISFIDQAGDMRSLADISGQLRTRTAQMSNAQRTALFATLAGTDGVRTLLSLYNAGPGTISKYSAQLSKAGTATQMAATMNDNAAGKFKQLMASLQAAGIEIGSALLPPLVAVAQAFAGLISKFTAFKPLAYAAAAAVGVVVAAMAVNKVVAFSGAVMQAARSIGILSAVSTVAGTAGTGVAGVGVAAASAAPRMAMASRAMSSFGAAAGILTGGLKTLGPYSASQAGKMTRLGAAGGQAKMGMMQLAGAIPLVANPIGLLAGIAVAGAVGLLMFGKRTDVAALAQQNLAAASQTTMAALGMVSQAFSAQATGITAVRTSSDAVTRSQQAATVAARNYTVALREGRAEGESQVAFLQRLDALYLRKVQTEQTASAATQTASQRVSALATATERSAGANAKQISTLEGTRTALANQSRGMNIAGASEAQKNKIAHQSLVTEAALGTAQRNRVRDLTAGIAAGRAARTEVQRSNATDAEKVVATERINKSLQGMGRELQAAKKVKVDPKIELAIDNPKKRLKELRDALDGVGTKPWNVRMQVKDEASPKIDTVTAKLDEVKPKAARITAPGADASADKVGTVASLLDRITSRSATVTVTTVKRGDGGFIPGFAGGGTVRGPGGRDRVPAMLTAGEVVLTKRQQSLVDGGMNIRDAIRSTGGAYAKGGFVAPKRNKGEGDKEYRARVKAAKAKWKSTRMDAMAPAFQAAGDAIKTASLSRFDRETQKIMRGIERTFTGTGDVAGKSFAQLDSDLAANLKSIEENFRGTGAVAGHTFKSLDKEMKAAQKQLNATFDALTPAEAQIKALQDAGSQEELTGSLSAAQAELAEAQKYGDTQGAIEAQKKLREAERAMAIAELTKTAEAERAVQETSREAAQEALDTEYEGKRATLQTQLDGMLQTERTAAEVRQGELQRQLDERMVAEQDTRDQLRVEREIELEALGANLLKQRGKYLTHFKDVRAAVNRFANRMRAAGANVGKSIALGLDASKGELKGAAKGLADLLADFLRTASPTKKGPMSDLDHWWDGFAPALMHGLDTSRMEAGIASSVGAPGTRAGAGAGGSVTINLTVNDSTLSGMSREQADRVASQIKASLDRQIRVAI